MAADLNDPDRKEFDWDLPINVPTIGVHRTLRVTSNESIGAVMIKLASKLGKHEKIVLLTTTSTFYLIRYARGVKFFKLSSCACVCVCVCV